MTRHLVPRHKQTIITDDTIAIRKMRELRQYTRTHAGILLTLSGKQIEAIENGRVQLTDSRIDDFCSAYKVSRVQYESIKSGKQQSLLDPHKSEQSPKIIDNKLLRRSYKKVVDRKVRAIISLRHLAGLTQDGASFKCGYARCQFGQIENGRVELSEKRIRHIVCRLGFTVGDYQRELNGDQTSYEMRDECASILKGLMFEQLQSIFPLLKSLDAAKLLNKSA